MAETLSSWLASGLLTFSERYKLSTSSAEEKVQHASLSQKGRTDAEEGGGAQRRDKERRRDQMSIVSDVPFFKGNKVQIVRFHTYTIPTARAKIPPSTSASASGSTSEAAAAERSASDGDAEGLWCTVADRRHYVLARISREAVEWFEATNDGKPFTSIRGSIVVVRSVRPSITLRIGEDHQPRFFLEISAFQLLGAIGEVPFWETTSLEAELGLLGSHAAVKAKRPARREDTEQEKQSKRRLKRWYVKGTKALQARHEEKRARHERKNKKSQMQQSQEAAGHMNDGAMDLITPSMGTSIATSNGSSSDALSGTTASTTASKEDVAPPAGQAANPRPSSSNASIAPPSALPTQTLTATAAKAGSSKEAQPSVLADVKANHGSSTNNPWGDFDLEREAEQIDLISLDAIQRDDGGAIPIASESSMGSSSHPSAAVASIESQEKSGSVEEEEERRGKILVRDTQSNSQEEQTDIQAIPATKSESSVPQGTLPSTSNSDHSQSQYLVASPEEPRAPRGEKQVLPTSTLPELTILSDQSIPFLLNGEREESTSDPPQPSVEARNAAKEQESVQSDAGDKDVDGAILATSSAGRRSPAGKEPAIPTSSAPSSSQQSDIPVRAFKTVADGALSSKAREDAPRKAIQASQEEEDHVLSEKIAGNHVSHKSTASDDLPASAPAQISQLKRKESEQRDQTSVVKPKKKVRLSEFESVAENGSHRSASIADSGEDKKGSSNKELLRRLLESKRKQREHDSQEAQRRYEEKLSKIIY